MQTSYDKDQERSFERWLSKLTAKSEVLLCLAPDVSNSCYKCYARIGPNRKFWNIGHEAYTLRPWQPRDPRATRRGIETHLVTLPQILAFRFHPEREALARLWARAMELAS